MDLEQLRALARDWLDDEVEPPLWSDERIEQYLNEALREAALRARMLLDSTTPTVCEVDLVVGQSEYDLHPSVIFVRRAVRDLDLHNPLTRVQHAVIDSIRPGWRTDSGSPTYLIPNLQKGKFTLSPTPDAVDTLRLTVVRYPLDAELLAVDDDVPPIDEILHEKLVHWVCWRALMKRDTEGNMPAEAERHLGFFEEAFGSRPSAKQLMALATEPTTSTESYFF